MLYLILSAGFELQCNYLIFPHKTGGLLLGHSMGSAARASLLPGARLRDITCAMGVATTASRFLPLRSRRFWGLSVGWFWISMVAKHTIDTKGWLWAFQLLVQIYTSLSPVRVLSLHSVFRTRFTQDGERKGMKCKDMMPLNLLPCFRFLLAKVHLKFCGFKSAKTSFLGRNQKFGGPMDDQYSFRCWTKILSFWFRFNSFIWTHL